MKGKNTQQFLSAIKNAFNKIELSNLRPKEKNKAVQMFKDIMQSLLPSGVDLGVVRFKKNGKEINLGRFRSRQIKIFLVHERKRKSFSSERNVIAETDFGRNIQKWRRGRHIPKIYIDPREYLPGSISFISTDIPKLGIPSIRDKEIRKIFEFRDKHWSFMTSGILFTVLHELQHNIYGLDDPTKNSLKKNPQDLGGAASKVNIFRKTLSMPQRRSFTSNIKYKTEKIKLGNSLFRSSIPLYGDVLFEGGFIRQKYYQ